MVTAEQKTVSSVVDSRLNGCNLLKSAGASFIQLSLSGVSLVEMVPLLNKKLWQRVAEASEIGQKLVMQTVEINNGDSFRQVDNAALVVVYHPLHLMQRMQVNYYHYSAIKGLLLLTWPAWRRTKWHQLSLSKKGTEDELIGFISGDSPLDFTCAKRARFSS